MAKAVGNLTAANAESIDWINKKEKQGENCLADTSIVATFDV